MFSLEFSLGFRLVYGLPRELHGSFLKLWGLLGSLRKQLFTNSSTLHELLRFLKLRESGSFRGFLKQLLRFLRLRGLSEAGAVSSFPEALANVEEVDEKSMSATPPALTPAFYPHPRGQPPPPPAFLRMLDKEWPQNPVPNSRYVRRERNGRECRQ